MIKPPFEIVVTENSPWLMRYIRQKVQNPSIAEDIMQETFLKAFRNYDSYVENGKIRAWLTRIAANTISNYYTGKSAMVNMTISFDYDIDIVDNTDSPDDIVIHDEMVKQIMSIIWSLNDRDREIMYYRYIYDMSVEKTSEMLGIPKGTVKSRTHNTITKIQKQMGVEITSKLKGVHNMKCTEAYKYLFMYARNTISDENKQLVEKHIADCKECGDIASALKQLIPQLATYALDDEATHINIHFDSHTYSMIRRKGDLNNMSFGYTADSVIVLAIFDNYGKEILYEDVIQNEKDNYHRVYLKYDSDIPDPMEQHTVYFGEASPMFSKSKSTEAPNLYSLNYFNYYGGHVKTSLYAAIPKEATNIRIKRGNGVIDCGTYKFVYASRYTDDEGIHIDATFNM